MRILIAVPVLVLAVWMFGTPHVLTNYQCGGLQRDCFTYSRCDYLGVEGIQLHFGPACPFIRMMPLKWRPFV
jgi:hypothetical protein